MEYKENPKTKGSGIICGIPQDTPHCSGKCKDCFCLSGRSYLYLEVDLPNLPPYNPAKVLRVNDGLDSNDNRDLVIDRTSQWRGHRFFNTSKPIPFDEPWVLTVNPGETTDTGFQMIPIHHMKNLMFVRFRANVWNIDNARSAVWYYTGVNVPVVLTFMAYYKEPVPTRFKDQYETKKRTLNTYKVIKVNAWKRYMEVFARNPLVYSCSGPNNFKCRLCGTCLREFNRVSDQCQHM